ncbi:uncharacterized protein LOC131151804 [Malania oleifera]|uniref:uncharacterized protein LOC131151804 n=1 Tax=Malania oleifera TaxID=397392 RepID=UPI0025ADF9EF|nr:uncharacterized protein LOC131151804 [Malania oleifera]
MASITLDELHTFHAVDRELFTQLVINSKRDPSQSLLVMALWLWLEDKGYPSVIQKMLRLSDSLVDKIADEAVFCLKYLESKSTPTIIPPDGGIPLTAGLMERDISLRMFNQNKFTAISGVKSFLNNVCARIFADILHLVLGSTSQETLRQSLVIPGFPHPVFGDVTIIKLPLDYSLPIRELWCWDRTEDIPEDDRTMFLTFSRGFPVSEAEVRELFTRLYGDCVDSILMELVPANEQPLYARMVLRSVTTIDEILNGKPISKFRINGKHIWTRKYEKRDIF